MEMSINRALAEIKLLDKKIERAIEESVYIGLAQGKKPPVGYETVAELENRIKSNYDSVKALIERRRIIKSKVVESNAVTFVKVVGESMSVADAIERKTSIGFDKALLRMLVNNYNNAVNTLERKNGAMQSNLDQHIQTMLGTDAKKNKSEETELISKAYLEMYETKLIDPLNLQAVVENLTKRIEEFEHEIDYILSESNTVTKIEV